MRLAYSCTVIYVNCLFIFLLFFKSATGWQQIPQNECYGCVVRVVFLEIGQKRFGNSGILLLLFI